MLIIRDIFTAKPGQASKLARLFRDMITELDWKNARVMTDLVSNMHTVVLETQFPSLAAFEEEMRGYSTGPNAEKMAERMKGYNDMYYKGKREVLQITE